MKGHRVYKAVAAALAIGSIVAACSSNNGVMPLGSTGSGAGQTQQIAGGKPVRGKLLDLGNLLATATSGSMVETLTAVNSGSSIVLTDGTPCGGSPDACAISNHANWPSMNLAGAATLTVAALTSTVSCPTSQCYVVAYEGGVGPYIVSGPGTGAGGSGTAFPASSALSFEPTTSYNFFIESVSGISATPVPPGPTAVPTATFLPTQPPPPTPTAVASLMPSSCPSTAPTATPPPKTISGRNDGGDDDGGNPGSTGSCCPATNSSNGGSRSWGDDARRYDGSHQGAHEGDGGDEDSAGSCCGSGDGYGGDGDRRHRHDGGHDGSDDGACYAPSGTHATPTPQPTKSPKPHHGG